MFKKRLKIARNNKGFTQQFMADSLNIGLRTYQTYEGGTREPSINTLIKLADILDVSMDFLFGRDEFIKSHEEFFDEH